MNKQLRLLKTKMESKIQEVKDLNAEGKINEAEKAFAEYEEFKKKFDLELKVFNEESATSLVEGLEIEDMKSKAVNGFNVITKMIRRTPLTEDESKSLVIGGENGETALVPEDVRLAINEVRSNYKSAKDVVSVLPTTALSGSLNYEVDDDVELIEFADGEAIDNTKAPKFVSKNFTIKFFGLLIPIGRILAGAEKAGLMFYLNKWFIKKAIRTENKKIFAELKTGKAASNVKGWKALKSKINKIDPSCLIDGVIVTNQTGFDLLDSEEDTKGRPILQENPANKTQKLFQGLVIEVFSDKEFPNVNGKAPMYIGATKAGVLFVEYESIEFAVSEHALFGNNQNAIRVIEGFTVMGADKNAYEYITFEATPIVEPAPAGN